MEWISVKDRLPNHEQVILTINCEVVDESQMYHLCKFDAEDLSDNKFIHEYCPYFCSIPHTTHWMPLPNPPK